MRNGIFEIRSQEANLIGTNFGCVSKLRELTQLSSFQSTTSFSFLLFVLLSFTPVDEAYAQSEVSNGYNPLSLRQVHESYLMWKRTLWRRVDLMEKQNKPFFAINRELSKVIIEAVQNGVLIP